MTEALLWVSEAKPLGASTGTRPTEARGYSSQVQLSAPLEVFKHWRYRAALRPFSTTVRERLDSYKALRTTGKLYLALPILMEKSGVRREEAPASHLFWQS